MVPYASQDASWSVLINHGGEELAWTSTEMNWPRTVGPLPPYRVTLMINDLQQRKPLSVTCGGHAIEWAIGTEGLGIPLTMDTLWKVIKITWKPCDDGEL